ncbi:hypothetical protein AMETH_2644 [Amycolatopsis methanolica 239]|uniref:Uncharacterized protein n=1 Tax=Amycolatopsis methanolica 239 TaxID=1068978 RepID=A0A076MUV3_AMYME|nr:hypothetical protein AMETH_2644 [Amycolatopsis methanolica 239]
MARRRPDRRAHRRAGRAGDARPGQPIGIARNVSVAAAAEHFRYYAGWGTKI